MQTRRSASRSIPTGAQAPRAQQRGFTLIELLVVVAIIGILSAIAIPQFALYRERAMRASVEGDARNAAASQEAYYIDNVSYSSDCATLPGFSSTENVSCTTVGDTSQFTVTTTHTISGYSCTWLSNPGTENMSCS